jgi:hypothetical protein
MTTGELGPNKWDLIEGRRRDDLSCGLVKQEERPGLIEDVVGQRGWQCFYEDAKHYRRNPAATIVRVYSNKDNTLVAKIDDPGCLIDQAGALARVKAKFGVSIPKDLVYVTGGGTSMLVMEKLDFWTGYKIKKISRGLMEVPPKAAGVVKSEEYRELYQQARTVAHECADYLETQAFDVVGLHRGNWGIAASAVDAWRPGKKLQISEVLIFDPVSMRYDRPSSSTTINPSL